MRSALRLGVGVFPLTGPSGAGFAGISGDDDGGSVVERSLPCLAMTSARWRRICAADQPPGRKGGQRGKTGVGDLEPIFVGFDQTVPDERVGPPADGQAAT